jgi:hypothetical protein
MKPAGFLDKLPLEIREQIYSDALTCQDGEYYDCHIESPRVGHCCPVNLLLCNRQVNSEVRKAWRRREVFLSSCHTTGRIRCSVPCFHGLGLSSTSVQFDINPFQCHETIVKLWNSITLLCTVLAKAKDISKLEIRCDGKLPRRKPPLYINELDIERGPLNIVLLLQPFCLLANVRYANISILGGPLNSPWSKDMALQGWTQRHALKIESSLSPRVEENKLIADLQRRLNGEGLVWDTDLYRSEYAKLLSEGSLCHK